MPESLRSAIASGGSVGLSTLTNWGRRAHLNIKPEKEEAQVLQEALVANSVRARAAALLRAHPPTEGEHELLRLDRVLKAMASTDDDADLRETLRAIVAFERCFRLALMAFQRLLSQCQRQEPFAVELAATSNDKPLAGLLDEMPEAFDTLDRSLVEAQTHAFRADLVRLTDARSFLQAVATAKEVSALVEQIIDRHRDVQQAKRDGGRAKMPWLEIRNGKVVPTMSSAMRILRPPAAAEDVLAHPYRTSAVDNFQSLGGDV